MAIKISQGFKVTSAEPIEEKLTLTLAQMKAADDAEMPSSYFTICQDDGKLYLYNKLNTVDTNTGKFRVHDSGGGTGTTDWGNIGGTITNQTDLVNYINNRPDAITNQDIDKIIFGE